MTSKIFAMRIPVVGISACDFASFLKVLVDAVDKLVNECTECQDDSAVKSPFSALEMKLQNLLQGTSMFSWQF